ncbi:uncharacterized protein IL334_004336 [Kwoniella shivajii]|uniref:Uncharacterized protein n=1 Tax=Kwoniella shivajii TaxID=564305 RepID=A0ABZ1D0G1_9TREE|nr:hypothetical protein IL334_004336 [Kwoniella shivajii]
MDIPLSARQPLMEGREDLESSTNRAGDRSSNGTHGKHTKWMEIPFRRIAHILLAIITLAVIILTVLGSLLGYHKYRRIAFPHRQVHASPATAKDGSRVVKPYFAPKDKGGVETGCLVMKIWFREGIAYEEILDPASNDYWIKQQLLMDQISGRRLTGEQGFVGPELGKQGSWEEVWTGSMDDLGIEEKRTTTSRVVLPGKVIHSLVVNHRSSLVATFELLPQTLSNTTSLTYHHNTTRPVAHYGPSQPWPLPYSLSAPPATPATLNAFFAYSSIGANLYIRTRDWRSMEMDNTFDFQAEERKEIYVTFLSTRTWITMASDYSVYGVEGFESAMNSLREFKETCANDRFYWFDCYRKFARDGHFENLLEVDKINERKEWRYGPFLTTRLSPTTIKDYVELPAESKFSSLDPSKVQDFAFDWQLTYSSLSATKLSLAKLSMGPNVWELLSDDSQAARTHDDQELHSALLGLSFNPDSHPMARGLVGITSTALRCLAIPSILHYWTTRRVSTGIALLTLTFQSITDLVYYIVTTVLSFEEMSIFFFVIGIICFILIILKQLHLYFKADVRLTTVKLPSVNIAVPFPVAVRFRFAAVEEKTSYASDAKFDWRLRILIVVGTFLILEFAPPPPAIVSAAKYSDVMQGFGGARHWDATAIKVLHIFHAFQGSVWLVSRLSQIHLNHRNKTFAGSYGITAYLLFASLLLSHITKVFVRWFGRAQLMQPLTVWDIITVLVSAVLVVQARLLPKVAQSVNETSD